MYVNKSAKQDKKILLSFEERKIMARKEINKNNNKEGYLNAFYYYDIDEEINKEYLWVLLNLKDDTIQSEFNRLMYTLKIDDRNDLNNNIKKKNNRKGSQEIFDDILKLIISKKINLQIFEKSLLNENFIEVQNFKIPFYEGNDEYFFAGLVNQFNLYLCLYKNEPNENDIDNENNNVYSTCNFTNNTPTIKKQNFISKTTAQRINIEKNNQNNNTNLSNVKNNDSDSDSEMVDINNIFLNKIDVIKPYIEIYQSIEFKKKINELKQIDNWNKIKRIYPIFILHILISYCGFEIMNKNLLKDSLHLFYEYEIYKKLELEAFLRHDEQIKIYDENNKKIDLNNIINKNYFIEKNGEKYQINFYDHRLYDFQFNLLKFQELKEWSNNIENWTLQKHAKENQLFFNKNISEIIEENIYNSIKINSVLKEAFYEVLPFNNYNYPFQNNKIISQIKNAIFIFPFCCDSIAGLTLKKFGVILFNNRLKKIELKLDERDYVFYFLLKGMIYKTIFIHEINFHYVFCLIYYNNYSKSFDTPERLFKNFDINEGDSGTRGEILLFGKKVQYMFINAALYISDDNLWKLKDNYFEEVANMFLSLNQPATNKIDFDSLLKNNMLINKIYNIITNEIKIKKRPKTKKRADYKNYFSYGNLRDDEDLIEEPLPEGLFLLKGTCKAINN